MHSAQRRRLGGGGRSRGSVVLKHIARERKVSEKILPRFAVKRSIRLALAYHIDKEDISISDSFWQLCNPYFLTLIANLLKKQTN